MPPFCLLTAIGNYLQVEGSAPGSLFPFQDGTPLSCQHLASRAINLALNRLLRFMISELVRPQLQPHVVSRTTSSKTLVH